MINVVEVEPDNCYEITIGNKFEYISALFLNRAEEKAIMSKDKNQIQKVLESYISELEHSIHKTRSLINSI